VSSPPWSDIPLSAARRAWNRGHVYGFRLLFVDGESAMVLPYSERRELLEELDLIGPAWHTPSVFDDGEALYEVVCAQGLEGFVAKRLSSRYSVGERGWVKRKNPAYWRLEDEREGWRSRRRSLAAPKPVPA
jgi:bifunctional non-homologous end joining protein LigD